MFTVDLTHTFHAAHRLPDRPGVPTKCLSVHGHAWTTTITLAAPTLDTNGMVIEFGAFKQHMRDWIDTHLDHATMLSVHDPLATPLTDDPGTHIYWFGPGGDYTGYDAPTVEVVAALLGHQAAEWLANSTPRTDITVKQVRVQETEHNTATWTNPEPTPAIGVHMHMNMPPSSETAAIERALKQLEHARTDSAHATDDLVLARDAAYLRIKQIEADQLRSLGTLQPTAPARPTLPPRCDNPQHDPEAPTDRMLWDDEGRARHCPACHPKFLNLDREAEYMRIKQMETDATLAAAADAPPYIGQIVHYTSYGTPGGEYPSVCRAAIVTETDPGDHNRVGLTTINPTGLFWHPLTDGGCYRSDQPRGGTWHLPHTTEAR